MLKTIASLPRHRIAVRHHSSHQTVSDFRLVKRIIIVNCCHTSKLQQLRANSGPCYVARRHYGVNGKIYSILHNMPKKVDVKGLQELRLARKQKVRHYRPSTVYLQVLGSGAPGAPRSLYVFTEQARYLFNCGEGSQRLAHEHKVKLGMMEHILITHKSWDNVGGLPGILLTLQDMGVPEITLHGPPGIDSLYYDTRNFMRFRDLTIYYRNYEENGGRLGVGNDPLYIWSVPLWAKSNGSVDANLPDEPLSVEEIFEEVEDLFAHEQQKSRRTSPQNRDITSSQPRHPKQGKSAPCKNLSVAYICRPPPKAGKLLLDQCVKAGVPPGPLLGELKRGQDVTLPNGNVVHAVDVTEPDDPGPVFIVVEVPTEQYLDALLENEALASHQCGATREGDVAEVIVHFTPTEVVNHHRYQEWMARFPTSTSHIFINSSSACMGSQAVHRIQYKLNHLNNNVFPLLLDGGIPIRETNGDEGRDQRKDGGEAMDHTTSDVCMKHQSDDNHDEGEEHRKNGGEVMEETVSGVCMKKISDNGNGLEAEDTLGTNSSQDIGPTYQASTLLTYHIRPKKQLDRSAELSLQPQSYIQECYGVEKFESIYQQLQSKLDLLKAEGYRSSCSSEAYPNVIFLGTGSCIPNKTRNTSGILLNLSYDKCVLMDCSEGTYGQLVRLLGVAGSDLALQRLKAVYVSHLHADHHIGFIRLLQARKKAFQRAEVEHIPKLLLLAPSRIMAYLISYHNNFEPILNYFTLYGNQNFLSTNLRLNEESYSQLCSELDMKAIDMTYVIHCPNSFGVAWTHNNGWKVVYSGDTMPCKALVEIGKDCDLLIHEATMEDELEEDARIKTHCTTSQAIKVGQHMNAKFTILTHFSQRYAKVPIIEDLPDQVGIAFDNMWVSLKALPTLPLMNDALMAMFADDYDEMLEKTAKKRAMREKQEKQIDDGKEMVKVKQRKIDKEAS